MYDREEGKCAAKMSLIQQLDAAKDITEEENIGRAIVNSRRKRTQSFVMLMQGEQNGTDTKKTAKRTDT